MNKDKLSFVTPEAAIQDIKQKGDPIDRQILMSRLHPGQITLGFEGAALGASLTPNFNYLAQSLLTYPTYGLAGLALAAGTYGGLRHVDSRNAARAEKSQSELRTTLKEPVDLITTGKGKKRELTMRWYGADNTSVNTALETVARYKSIVTFAEAQGIERVAVDAAWAEAILAKADATDENPAVAEFGDLMNGETFVSDLKKATLNIHDTESADEVLISNTEQAKALVAAMELSGKELLLGELVRRTGDRALMDEYALLKKTEGKSHGRLLEQVHGRLEMILNQETSSVIRTRNDAWQPVRERVHRHNRIQGEYIHTTIQPTANATHTTKSSFEIGGILDRFGARTLNQLVGNILKSPSSDFQRDETLAAIYLLALRRDKQQYDGTSVNRQKPRRTLGDPETLFERLPDQPRGFLSDMLHARKVRKSEDLSIEYAKKKSHNRRIAAIATFGIATAVFGGLQWGSGEVGGGAFVRQTDWCDENGVVMDYDLDEDFRTRFDEYLERCSAAYSEIDQMNTTVTDVYIAKTDAEWEIAKATTSVLIDTVGPSVIAAAAPYMVNSVSDDWKERAMEEIPPSFYAQSVSESFIGDAGVETNKVVYTVESLHGDSTEGYWYGASFDEMVLSGDNISYRANGTPYSIGVPGQTFSTDELDAQADYKVSTPYLDVPDLSISGINMPMLAGTELVGIRVVDANDPSKISTITDASLVAQDGSDIYSVKLYDYDIQSFQRAGIEKPVFTYWTSKKSEDTTGDYYIQPMRYPVAGGVYVDEQGNVTNNVLEAMSQGKVELDNRIKTALGLSVDATSAEVKDAIASKQYSFTPMADAKIDSLTYAPVERNDTYGALSQIGETLASMESLNCNLAATAFLLGATQDMPDVNLATGFHDDGDGLLTQREAHAWVIDENSTIYDATPSGFTENSNTPNDGGRKPDGATTDSLSNAINPGIVGGLIGGVGAILAFRKRRQLLQAADTLRVKIASGDPNAEKALHVIEHALYGPQGETIDWAAQLPEPVSDMTRRMGQVAKMTKKPNKDARIVASLDNPTLSKDEKKAVLKLAGAAKSAARL